MSVSQPSPEVLAVKQPTLGIHPEIDELSRARFLRWFPCPFRYLALIVVHEIPVPYSIVVKTLVATKIFQIEVQQHHQLLMLRLVIKPLLRRNWWILLPDAYSKRVSTVERLEGIDLFVRKEK